MRDVTTHPITADDLAYARHLLRSTPEPLREMAQDWYSLVNARCRVWARETGYSVEQCAAVLALYSINASWKTNTTCARRALYEGRIVGMRTVTCHVRAILAGEPIELHLTRGSKVRNFYRSIMLLPSCTIDRWMFRIFGRPLGEEWYPGV